MKRQLYSPALPNTRATSKTATGATTKAEISVAVGASLDKVIALFLVLVLSPILIINMLCAGIIRQAVFTQHLKTDALGRTVILQYFNCGVAQKSALLFSIILGKLRFIGVPLTHSLMPQRQRTLLSQTRCQAGLFSLYDLHQATGLVTAEPEYLLQKQFKLSILGYVLLLIKSVICCCIYVNAKNKLASSKLITIFGLTINNISMANAVKWTTSNPVWSANTNAQNIASGKKHTGTKLGFFINAHSINVSLSEPKFHHTLQQADMLLADGSGMRLAAKSAGYFLKENTNGTDMLPHLCKHCVEQNKSLYFFGSKPGVARQAAANLKQQFPHLKIVGCQHGYVQAKQYNELIADINTSGCDVLLVALGSPIQEQWLLEHRAQLTCHSALAVGGLFDFYSGQIARAPLWIRELGMEWIWRLIKEPTAKFKRYIVGNPLFLFRIFILGLASKGAK